MRYTNPRLTLTLTNNTNLHPTSHYLADIGPEKYNNSKELLRCRLNEVYCNSVLQYCLVSYCGC